MSTVVKRTYFSKKLGKNVTKTYTYNKKYVYKHKSKKGYVLVDKRGRVIQKNVDRMKDAIQSGDYSEAQKRTMIADLNAIVKNRKKNQKKLTTRGYMGIQAEDSINRLLANAGYSLEEFSEETGISEDDIMNPDNWKDGKFKFKDRTIAFQWTYTGNFWRDV